MSEGGQELAAGWDYTTGCSAFMQGAIPIRWAGLCNLTDERMPAQPWATGIHPPVNPQTES
ncbi:MAG: hypothetical protein R2867_46980 [Caldilineaceae bacterium]